MTEVDAAAEDVVGVGIDLVVVVEVDSAVEVVDEETSTGLMTAIHEVAVAQEALIIGERTSDLSVVVEEEVLLLPMTVGR